MYFKLSKSVLDKTIATASKMPWGWFGSSSSAVRHHSQQAQSTMDSSEVERFSKQMEEWWDLDGYLNLLHKFNTLRVPLVRDGLVPCSPEQRELLPLRDKKILDVGCGGGILSEGLARLGAQVTGIDASKELLQVAEEHKHIDPKIADCKPTYVHTTVEDHANEFLNHYDGVVASEVIEHVNNPELFVKSCVQTLKPGGRIFFTTPNRTRISHFVTIFMAEYVLNWIRKGTHQYEKFITPNELTFMLERNNCHVEAIYGMQYNVITRKFEYCKYQQLMYAIQAQKLS